MPTGGRGGFGFGGFGRSRFGSQQVSQEELPHFAVTREDPAVSGTKGIPSSLPKWGGGTGFGTMENQIFRVYRYTADYPGLKGNDLKPLDIN